MASLFMLFFACTLGTSEAVYVWTEWSKNAICLRQCSKASGTTFYRRNCMKCAGALCTPVDSLYCGGQSEKTELCYVGSQCFGQGTYRGQWTEWTNSGLCPSVGEHCTGEKVVSFRRCILPAAYQRRSMTFRCPGDQSVKKVEPCPCEVSVWSEWSEWTLCPPSGTGTRKRHRVCVMQNNIECTGGSMERSLCPSAVQVSARGRPRIRKVRDDALLEDVKNDMMQLDWAKSMMGHVSKWTVAGAFGGVLAFMFASSLGLMLIVTHVKRKAAKKAKKKLEQSKPPTHKPLLAPYAEVPYRPPAWVGGE